MVEPHYFQICRQLLGRRLLHRHRCRPIAASQHRLPSSTSVSLIDTRHRIGWRSRHRRPIGSTFAILGANFSAGGFGQRRPWRGSGRRRTRPCSRGGWGCGSARHVLHAGGEQRPLVDPLASVAVDARERRYRCGFGLPPARSAW
jgi:hypothetical protein